MVFSERAFWVQRIGETPLDKVTDVVDEMCQKYEDRITDLENQNNQLDTDLATANKKIDELSDTEV